MLSRGELAWWDPAGRRAQCEECAAATPSDPWAVLDTEERGRAGASAQAVYERRARAREARVRSRHPVLGGAILALAEEPTAITAWRTGAEGERRLGRRLDRLAETGRVEVLHDRALPGSRANLDHLDVGPSGVFVIDAKRYRGKLEVRRGGAGSRREPDRLFVGGRDRTRLVDAAAGQAEQVRRALGHLYSAPPIMVMAVLCFVGAEWPLVGAPAQFGEVGVVDPRGLERLATRPGSIGHNQRLSLARRLAAVLPPAAPTPAHVSPAGPG